MEWFVLGVGAFVLVVAVLSILSTVRRFSRLKGRFLSPAQIAAHVQQLRQIKANGGTFQDQWRYLEAQGVDPAVAQALMEAAEKEEGID